MKDIEHRSARGGTHLESYVLLPLCYLKGGVQLLMGALKIGKRDAHVATQKRVDTAGIERLRSDHFQGALHQRDHADLCHARRHRGLRHSGGASRLP